jgi:hypothetical protein
MFLNAESFLKKGKFLKNTNPRHTLTQTSSIFFFFPGCSPPRLGFHLRTVVRSRPLNRATDSLRARPISPPDGPCYSSCRAVTLANIFSVNHPHVGMNKASTVHRVLAMNFPTQLEEAIRAGVSGSDSHHNGMWRERNCCGSLPAMIFGRRRMF